MARGKAITIGALLAAALIGGLVLMLPSRKPLPSWTLSDGTKLQLLKVTYGTNHAVDYGHRLVDKLYPLVPAAYRKKFNFQDITIPVPPPGGVVVWLERSGTPTNQTRVLTAGGTYVNLTVGPSYSVKVFEESGFEAPGARNSRTMTNGPTIDAVMFTHYPRRAKTLSFLLYELPSASGSAIGEFRIPNPAPQRAPEWKPEPLPATRRTNGLEVTLSRLEAVAPESNSQLRGQYGIGTQAAFELRESGRPTTDWDITRITFTNAVGEFFQAPLPLARPGIPENLGNWVFQAPLWDEEPAWKMQVEVARVAGLPQDSTWTIKALALPSVPNQTGVSPPGSRAGAARITLSNVTTNLFGSQVALTGIQVTGVPRVVASSPSATSATLILTFEVPDALWLTVPQISDDQGRKLELRGTSSRPATGATTATRRLPQQIFRFALPEGANTVNVVVGVSRVFTLEFMVKPKMAGI